jgi:FemAB-related protein (PEP-CTERM system-associated)
MKTASAEVVVRLAGEADEERWDAYALGHPLAEKYHLWGWRRVIGKTFGHPTPYLLAERAGAVAGVLPLAHLKSRVFGNLLVSLPFFNYGGILADSQAAGVALFEWALGLAAELRADQLELRHIEPLPWFQERFNDLASRNGASGHFLTRRHKVTMRLALPASPELLWAGLRSKLRSQVRRPLKEGCTARVGGAELAPDFYRVFARNMRDLGTPVYSRALFENVLAEFPAHARIAAVYHGGQPVAAGLVVGFKGILEVPWASSLRSHNHLAPNMLLYWTMLEFACQAGYQCFDFGRSSQGGSTCRFKEQWGASPQELNWHTWNATDVARDVSPQNGKFRLAISLWQRLPLPIANGLGPGLVKYIP